MTKKEAIDALKLMQAQVEWDYPMDYSVAIDMAIAALASRPDIIKCEECRHWKSTEFPGNNDIHTLNLASLPCKNWLTAGDWYCGSAERREDG